MTEFITSDEAAECATIIMYKYYEKYGYFNTDYDVSDEMKKVTISTLKDGKKIPIVSIERKRKELYGRKKLPIYIQEHFVVEQLWE